MAAACGDGNNARGRRRHIDLAQGVVPPGKDRALGSQGEAMPVAGGNGNDIDGSGGNGGLTGIVCAPRRNTTAGTDGEAVVTAARNGYGAQAGWHIALSAFIVAPGGQTPIAAQRQTVPTSGGNGN